MSVTWESLVSSVLMIAVVMNMACVCVAMDRESSSFVCKCNPGLTQKEIALNLKVHGP